MVGTLFVIQGFVLLLLATVHVRLRRNVAKLEDWCVHLDQRLQDIEP